MLPRRTESFHSLASANVHELLRSASSMTENCEKDVHMYVTVPEARSQLTTMENHAVLEKPSINMRSTNSTTSRYRASPARRVTMLALAQEESPVGRPTARTGTGRRSHVTCYATEVGLNDASTGKQCNIDIAPTPASSDSFCAVSGTSVTVPSTFTVSGSQSTPFSQSLNPVSHSNCSLSEPSAHCVVEKYSTNGSLTHVSDYSTPAHRNESPPREQLQGKLQATTTECLLPPDEATRTAQARLLNPLKPAVYCRSTASPDPQERLVRSEKVYGTQQSPNLSRTADLALFRREVRTGRSFDRGGAGSVVAQVRGRDVAPLEANRPSGDKSKQGLPSLILGKGPCRCPCLTCSKCPFRFPSGERARGGSKHQAHGSADRRRKKGKSKEVAVRDGATRAKASRWRWHEDRAAPPLERTAEALEVSNRKARELNNNNSRDNNNTGESRIEPTLEFQCTSASQTLGKTEPSALIREHEAVTSPRMDGSQCCDNACSEGLQGKYSCAKVDGGEELCENCDSKGLHVRVMYCEGVGEHGTSLETLNQDASFSKLKLLEPYTTSGSSVSASTASTLNSLSKTGGKGGAERDTGSDGLPFSSEPPDRSIYQTDRVGSLVSASDESFTAADKQSEKGGRRFFDPCLAILSSLVHLEAEDSVPPLKYKYDSRVIPEVPLPFGPQRLLEITEFPFLILWVYGTYWAVVVAFTIKGSPWTVWLSAAVASLLVGVGLNANAYKSVTVPKRRGSIRHHRQARALLDESRCANSDVEPLDMKLDWGMVIRFFVIPFGVSSLSGLTNHARDDFLLVFPKDEWKLVVAILCPAVMVTSLAALRLFLLWKLKVRWSTRVLFLNGALVD